MGGSLSEPGMLVDLYESIRLLDGDAQGLREIGWYFERLSFQQVVAGLLHVDDSIVLSLFCVPFAQPKVCNGAARCRHRS